MELDAGNRIFTTLPVVPVIQGEINMETPASAPDLVVQTPSVSDSSPECGRILHVEYDCSQPGKWRGGLDNVALLPLGGRDDLHGRYAGRHGRRERPFRFWSQ